MARLNFVIPIAMLIMLSLAVPLALARNIRTAMLTDEKKLHVGLGGFGGLGGGADIGGLPVIGGLGGYAGAAGGAGLHLGGNGLDETGHNGLGGIGGLGGGIGGIVP